MENRFLFRGKRKDNAEWVIGSLIQSSIRSWISSEQADKARLRSVSKTQAIWRAIEVDPSTICQCTGYEGIYEKDIFQCDDERYVIEWCDYSLCWEARAIGSSESISLGEFRPDEIVAIGNAIDNPELLEGSYDD